MSIHLDQPADVREGEQLDTDKLGGYLRTHLPDASGPLVVEQFPSGFSNLTYLLKLGDQELVLRRPPFGNRVKSAHDMGREFRVLSQLSGVYDLVPQPLVYCEDEAVLGAPFYVMQRCQGVILRSPKQQKYDLDAATLRGLGESFVDNLAALHAIDFAAAGLGDLGKPEGFIERQVAGWTKRYQQARTDDFPEMENIAGWLAEHLPPSSGVSLIHNDFKFDNLVLDPQDLTKIIAVLDWEMCTLGDPLLDLGVSLSYWVQEDDEPALKAFIAGPTNLPGNLTRREIVRRYEEVTGRDTSGILFHYCFGLFKLAVIVQQIYFRYAEGHTRDPRFAGLNRAVESLGVAALHVADRGEMI
ncbi:Putative aminoglycoside phosphotransferase [Symmachiella dynata]|uniref:Aminoglycoside phosphotransferase n=1 Tax=Symmachiella dynata TaxID=2527995 RepID=A0A517ZGT6_9PLAN|nr:phosphotransferase family protein [Symmachiella dynata]QDU41662.1 Putative aminoglycoside phosphotransferase [Symmachiella dynata]